MSHKPSKYLQKENNLPKLKHLGDDVHEFLIVEGLGEVYLATAGVSVLAILGGTFGGQEDDGGVVRFPFHPTTE
ncbi:MAG: hypothetical protein AAF433_21430 [Bacteroidota bacterium]